MYDLQGWRTSAIVMTQAGARYDTGVAAVRKAAADYQHLCRVARARRVWAAITGRSRALFDLDQVKRGRGIEGAYSAGVKDVPVSQIQGSEGRGDDFDAEFLPLQSRTQSRWVSVAAAYFTGVSLPPVELIQVGERYFVRDGHHRISVARFAGQEYIEAEVTVWMLKPEPVVSPATSTASAHPFPSGMVPVA